MTGNVWLGKETIAVTFDIGSTQSAASIVHLVPNQPFTVRAVTRWPFSLNSSKIPTSILYDDYGTPQAIGAETEACAEREDLTDLRLTECKWFKLHLHPAAMEPPPYDALSGSTAFPELPPLPRNVSVEQAYSDFITYLFDNTKTWFALNTPDGQAVWRKLKKTIKVIISHPNGWSLPQQKALKRAITTSAIILPSDIEDNVYFVTESEASVHFALLYSAKRQSQWLLPQSNFTVVDAGGSVINMCTYKVSATQPKLKLREARTCDCTQSGGIFVTRAAEEVFKAKLGRSEFNTPEFVGRMVDFFDTNTKLVFNSVEDDYCIKFGFDRHTDQQAGIVRGRLTLTGEEVQRIFEPCVQKILQSLREQTAGLSVSAILLVGGFGESPYLLRRIREEFEGPGTRVFTADEPSKKAVADGGCLFFAKDSVVGHATRLDFGISKGSSEDTTHPEDAPPQRSTSPPRPPQPLPPPYLPTQNLPSTHPPPNPPLPPHNHPHAHPPPPSRSRGPAPLPPPRTQRSHPSQSHPSNRHYSFGQASSSSPPSYAPLPPPLARPKPPAAHPAHPLWSTKNDDDDDYPSSSYFPGYGPPRTTRPGPISLVSPSLGNQPASRPGSVLRALRLGPSSDDVARNGSFADHEQDWAFRPKVEDVLEKIEIFFPKHDLEKQVFDALAPMAPWSSELEPPMRETPSAIVGVGATGLGHKQSIRVVAGDRKRNMLKASAREKHSGGGRSSLLRHESTKLFGSRIEEVTPAQIKQMDDTGSKSQMDDPENFSFKWIKGELIGRGSYGKVFIAFNVTAGEAIAVKQVELPHTASDKEDKRLQAMVASLKAEIELLKDLSHDHIVECLGMEETLEHLSIFLEYVPGGSVGRMIRSHGKFPNDVVKDFTFQILTGLNYLHGLGILHRDLKGDNILCDHDGSCKISDFGTSKKSQDIYSNNAEMSVQGSIFWMAPEVLQNNQMGYSAKADIWSLGCICLEMFAGRRPWDQSLPFQAMIKLASERLAPPVPEDVILSEPAKAFFGACVQVNPDLRPRADQLMLHPFLVLSADYSFRKTSLYRAMASMRIDAPIPSP